MSRVLFALLILVSAASAQTQIHVRPIHDARLPQVSAERMAGILDRAKVIIRSACGREVVFIKRPAQDMDTFLKAEDDRISPYIIPEDERVSPFADSAEACLEASRRVCADIKDFATIRSLLPAGEAELAVDAKSAAEVIAWVYSQRLEEFRRLTDATGQPLLDEKTWRRHSLERWGTYAVSADWTEQYTLCLTNTVLVDDALGATGPCSMAIGPVMNSVTLPASRAGIVAYHPAINRTLRAGNPHFPELTEAQQDAAIAHVIAQSIGVHLLVGRGNSFSAAGGLARPIQTLRKTSDLSDPGQLKLDPADSSDSSPSTSYTYKVLLRMDILAAQQQWQKVLDESNRAKHPLFDPKQRGQLRARVKRAEERLMVH